MAIPRRKIEEIAAIFKLEPSTRHIYVEGERDLDVYGEYIKVNSVNRSIYAINNIEVPPELTARHGLTDGNKQRVVALAIELSALIPDANIKCVVDKDFDQWMERLLNHKYLYYTKYSCMEMYFFSSNMFIRLFNDIFKVDGVNLEQLRNSIAECLTFMFAFRMANDKMNLNIKVCEIKNEIKILKGSINFDYEKLILRTLQNNGQSKLFQIVLHATLENKDFLKGDPRERARGNDYVEVLSKYLNAVGKGAIGTPEAIRSYFMLLAPQDHEIGELIA